MFRQQSAIFRRLRSIHIIRNVNVTSRTGHVKSNHNTIHILRQFCRRHWKISSSLSKNAEIFKDETCHDCSFADEEEEGKEKTKRMWAKEMIRERKNVGEYHTLYRQLEDDESSFYKYFRMSKQ